MQDNQALSKNELIQKLKEISAACKDILAIRKKIKNFKAEDKYERTVKVPPFPCDFIEEDLCKLKVKDSDIDDVEYIAEKYDSAKKPKAPKKPKQEKPTEPKKPNHEKSRSYYEKLLSKNATNVKIEKKPGKLAIGCGIVAIGIFLGGGLFDDDSVTVGFNFVLLIACLAGIAFSYYTKYVLAKRVAADLRKNGADGLKRLDEEEKKYEQDMKAYREALAASEQAYQEAMATYEKRMAAYQEALAAHEQNKSAFMQEYTQWREKYLAHLKEETKINANLIIDTAVGQQKIREEEYTPAKNHLKACNDLLTETYLPYVDTLIDLLMSGRADDLKEALNRLEEKLYREKQLELQREQEEQRQWEEEQRREDEERRHEEQMELQKQQEWQRRWDEDRRRDEEDRYRREEDRRRKEAEDDARRREREAEDRAKRDAKNRCFHCANRRTCTLKVNPPQNCSAFRP